MSKGSIEKWHAWRPYDSSKAELKETKKKRKAAKKSDSSAQTVFVDTSSSRFLSIDPHWEKYPSWTPYSYATNNPVRNTDPDGKDVIILNDRDAAYGAGHNGMIIGSDKIGWTYYSKDGADPNTGEQVYTKHGGYVTLNAFLKSDDAVRYQHGGRIRTTEKQDAIAMSFADKDLKTEYGRFSNNCADLIENTLESIGIELRGDELFGATIPNSQFAVAVYDGVANNIIHINHRQQDDLPSTLLNPKPHGQRSIYRNNPHAQGK